jgi:hypothetical protein
MEVSVELVVMLQVLVQVAANQVILVMDLAI